jgi:L-ribulose-5-phosphate 3-epimerase
VAHGESPLAGAEEEKMRIFFDRRGFLARSAAIALGGSLFESGALARSGAAFKSTGPAGSPRKAVCIGVLPRDLSVLDRFRLARRLGFEGIEPNTLSTPEEVEEYRRAAESTGLRIHSIMNSDHWKFPLTDDDPEVVRRSVDGIKTSLRNAHRLGADTVLLVPGIVTPTVRYGQVYERSQARIRELIPLARDLNVVIAVENVSNRFLLSPLEFARYIDEFESSWVKAYFDVGNVVSIGFPQDWIRTLGKRLVKVHVKRFEPGVDHPEFDPTDRRTQGIDWPDVRRALAEVGFDGWVSAEVGSGPEDYLRELGARMDRIFAGEKPY